VTVDFVAVAKIQLPHSWYWLEDFCDMLRATWSVGFPPIRPSYAT